MITYIEDVLNYLISSPSKLHVLTEVILTLTMEPKSVGSVISFIGYQLFR